MTAEPGFAKEGGLVQYGPSVLENWRHAATYVDKILKGAKPADLPVEQPTKFELVINMKTAKALGVKIPQSVLAPGGSGHRIAQCSTSVASFSERLSDSPGAP
jgi:putative ABC transport system substrate-binding protein